MSIYSKYYNNNTNDDCREEWEHVQHAHVLILNKYKKNLKGRRWKFRVGLECNCIGNILNQSLFCNGPSCNKVAIKNRL